MTTYNTIDPHHVTDDPTLLADLMARVDDLGSHELAVYAIGRGLTPPGYDPAGCYSIELAWPPDSDDAVLLWSTSRLGDDGVPAEEDEPGVWESARP